jgi:transposase
LPAYCPFYNPIEYLFGLVKRRLQKKYVENSRNDIRILITEIMNEFTSYSMKSIFAKCGYVGASQFDPTKGLECDMAVFGFQ